MLASRRAQRAKNLAGGAAVHARIRDHAGHPVRRQGRPRGARTLVGATSGGNVVRMSPVTATPSRPPSSSPRAPRRTAATSRRGRPSRPTRRSRARASSPPTRTPSETRRGGAPSDDPQRSAMRHRRKKGAYDASTSEKSRPRKNGPPVRASCASSLPSASRSAPSGFASASPVAPPAIASIAALPAGISDVVREHDPPAPVGARDRSAGKSGGCGCSSFRSSLITMDSNTGRSSTSRTGTRPIGEMSGTRPACSRAG